MAFGGIAGAIGAYMMAKKQEELRKQQQLRAQQEQALQQQYVRAQIAHMQRADTRADAEQGIGVKPFPGTAQPAGIVASAGSAPAQEGGLGAPWNPPAPSAHAAPRPTSPPAAAAAPASDYSTISAQAMASLKKAGDLEDAATYYDEHGATAVAARIRAQAQSLRAQGSAFQIQADKMKADSLGTTALPTMPKSLTQISPGNKGKGAATGSVPELQANYQHASSVAAWFASGQGGDLKDPRVKAQASLWEARAVQAAGLLKEAQIIGAADAYLSDFGLLTFIPHPYALNRDMLGIDPDMWAIGTLRGMTSEDLAKTGDSNKKMMVAEKTLICRNERSSFAVRDLS